MHSKRLEITALAHEISGLSFEQHFKKQRIQSINLSNLLETKKLFNKSNAKQTKIIKTQFVA